MAQAQKLIERIKKDKGTSGNLSSYKISDNMYIILSYSLKFAIVDMNKKSATVVLHNRPSGYFASMTTSKHISQIVTVLNYELDKVSVIPYKDCNVESVKEGIRLSTDELLKLHYSEFYS